jgi:hypothetical protein
MIPSRQSLLKLDSQRNPSFFGLLPLKRPVGLWLLVSSAPLLSVLVLWAVAKGFPGVLTPADGNIAFGVATVIACNFGGAWVDWSRMSLARKLAAAFLGGGGYFALLQFSFAFVIPLLEQAGAGE